MRTLTTAVAGALAGIAPSAAASTGSEQLVLGWTSTPTGWLAVAIFVVAYLFVVFEERLHLRKSKPVMLGAGLIWALIAWQAAGDPQVGADAVRGAFEHIFLEFAQLFFFLIVAMSFVAAMTERNVFEALRAELVSRGFGYRPLFWITGVLSFFLSAVLDNLTTALIMSAVILAVGAGNARFVTLAFINLVVAANAGGAWCAFGDITTLMVWTAHKVEFTEFFRIFLPSVVNFLVPAACMHFAVPRGTPPRGRDDADIRFGGLIIAGLFALTIVITVSAKNFLHMPAVFGMMIGLALLNLFGYVIKYVETHRPDANGEPYNVFRVLAQTEWDTLLFFYGVLLCVGGLATLGYLELASTHMYGTLGHTWSNIAMGTLSAIVDNIPIMYAVLQMSPPMDHGQWLLITLTAGVGGSMLSIGSAAGVALMGVSQGKYTFFGHLRWTWAVALGYIASIAVHLWWNAEHFTNGVWR
jgi:Na+/H+ antiporter NhaD/arsenite permease-like protein